MRKACKLAVRFFQDLANVLDEYIGNSKWLLTKDTLDAEPARKPTEEKKKEKHAETPEKKKERRKSTKTKDPNAPKKPLTAFMLFTNFRRPEIRKANPGSSSPLTLQSLKLLTSPLSSARSGVKCLRSARMYVFNSRSRL